MSAGPTLVIIPAAPVLLPGLGAVDPVVDVRAAARDALILGGARDAGTVAVLAAEPVYRDAAPQPASPVSAVAASAVRGVPPAAGAVVGWDVADHLLASAGAAARPVRLLPGQWPGEAPGALEPDVLVVVADGCASVGQKSPRAGNDGSGVDEIVRTALRTGDLSGLSALDDSTAQACGCTSAAVWRAVGDWAADRPWSVVRDAEFAPLGVSYWVAVLRP